MLARSPAPTRIRRGRPARRQTRAQARAHAARAWSRRSRFPPSPPPARRQSAGRASAGVAAPARSIRRKREPRDLVDEHAPEPPQRGADEPGAFIAGVGCCAPQVTSQTRRHSSAAGRQPGPVRARLCSVLDTGSPAPARSTTNRTISRVMPAFRPLRSTALLQTHRGIAPMLTRWPPPPAARGTPRSPSLPPPIRLIEAGGVGCPAGARRRAGPRPTRPRLATAPMRARQRRAERNPAAASSARHSSPERSGDAPPVDAAGCHHPARCPNTTSQSGLGSGSTAMKSPPGASRSRKLRQAPPHRAAAGHRH